MAFSTKDTIVAQATAPGAGARAILRLSGPRSASLVAALGSFDEPLLPARRLLTSGHLRLAELHSPLPADVYLWPAPRSYTGDEMAEIHLISSPPLVEAVAARILQGGARAAEPGEFTLRAFLAGKLDLTRAEAVLAVIEADSRSQLRQALAQLAGGLERPLQALREDLLNLLADVEAGLDFSDEDLQFVDQTTLLTRLGSALAQVMLVERQIRQRAASGEVFRVVLAGAPNAGKSSLFNALTGSGALVSDQPGTTRDYLVQRIELGRVTLELVDTAGWQTPTGDIDTQAQQLARQQAARADLVLLCVEAGRPLLPDEAALLEGERAGATLLTYTKGDLAPAEGPAPVTSVATGEGIEGLRRLLVERAASRREQALAPSLSRCRHHVTACLEHLRRAHTLVLEEDPPEILALELRDALHQLGEMVGAVYTDDLLDRIFSRFCIGK